MDRRSLLTGLASASLIIPLAGCAETEEGEPNENQGGEDTPTEETSTNENQGEENTSTEETSTPDEGSNTEFVDEADGQVQLTYGETAKLSNGVETTVHGVEIHESTGDHTPEEGDSVALVEVESFNGSDGEATILSETDPGIYVLYGDQQVEQTFNYGLFDEIDKNPYEVNDKVQSGVRRDGYILFEVGSGLTEADIDFLWQDEYFVAENLDGEVNVRWSAN